MNTNIILVTLCLISIFILSLNYTTIIDFLQTKNGLTLFTDYRQEPQLNLLAYSQYTQKDEVIAIPVQMRMENPTSENDERTATSRIEPPDKGFIPEPQKSSDETNGREGDKLIITEQEKMERLPSEDGEPPFKCLIATAAFGSELSPQVQFLRDFRDRHIMSTAAGSSFMNVFNSWYYTFSPYVANLERENPIFQEIVKVSIYPLLNILQISEKFYSIFTGEFGAILAGLSASSIIGLIYFTPILFLSKKIRKEYRLRKILSVCAISLVFSILLTIWLDEKIILMTTTSILVITTLTISSILFTRSISLISEKYLIKYLK